MPETTELDSQRRELSVSTLEAHVVDGVDRGSTAVAAAESLSVGTADGNDLVLSDPTVSRYHVELIRTEIGVRVVDHGSTNGTFATGVRIDSALVAPGTVLRLGRTKVEVREGSPAAVDVHGEEWLGGVLGRSQVMRRLMARLDKAAPTDVAVLLVGESGTGKEVLARAVHDLSPRQAGPYVIVDCGALSPQLIASELFGHERGAFTGADRQHVGAFERAHGGTLFLDEIGELPAEVQPMLLGALERRRFLRVGGTKEIAINVRILSATNRNLRQEINANRFRLDLFYRLAVISLTVPPLRDRPEDIPLLVQHFARTVGSDAFPDDLFAPDELHRLSTHRWPGNVRELRNLVEATVAMGEPPELHHAARLAPPPPLGSGAIAIARLLGRPYKDARMAVLGDFEAVYLTDLLERAGGNVSEAARIAHMDRSYLFSLLRKHALR